MNLIWLPEARDDTRRLFDFLVDKEPDAAVRMLQRVRTGAATLLEFPYSGKRMDEATERRELFVPFGVGAYVLRYRLRNETIVIIRVWHSRELRDAS